MARPGRAPAQGGAGGHAAGRGRHLATPGRRAPPGGQGTGGPEPDAGTVDGGKPGFSLRRRPAGFVHAEPLPLLFTQLSCSAGKVASIHHRIHRALRPVRAAYTGAAAACARQPHRAARSYFPAGRGKPVPHS
ncbi:hypothetical protein CBM2588_B90042 [Cupriavidus taiwanensis]|nr:hypothetical protein CBM2588_B90042 [Cupriavidus taiwanensis]